MVGSMVTSSKRAYAVPNSAAPRAPAPAAGHCWPVPPQETLTALSQSLWGLWVLVCTRYVWALWASLAVMGFYFNVIVPLLPSCCGFSALGRRVPPHSSSSTTQPPLQHCAAAAPVPTVLLGLLNPGERSRKCIAHSKHTLATTQENILHVDITRWSILKSDWLYSLKPKMEKLFTVCKNKTRSWVWLRS